MLRFVGENTVKQSKNIKVDIAEQHLTFDEKIWRTAKEYYKQIGYCDSTKVRLIPIGNAEGGGLVCYGWQDGEANRELRMLKELNREQNILQFGDIFPDIKEVIVWGCNELAYHFVKYLESLRIPVSVGGKYWEHFGYQSICAIDFEENGIMIIRAERILENKSDLFQRIIRSASPEFECIDKIYENNILAGNIKDIKNDGGITWLLDQLRDKDIVLLETDARAQDVYDFLYAHGIDIQCFATYETDEEAPRQLLGKRIEPIDKVLRNGKNAVLIDVHSKSSMWGNAYVELFDYYGYTRNKNFFVFSDYADVPHSNLLHVLKGKSLFLTGDERLCKILAEYLEEAEQGDIELRYAEVIQNGMLRERDIPCFVYLWYGQGAPDRKARILGEYLAKTSYTDYFSRIAVFVSIDQYRTRCSNRYCGKSLIPKGMLINNSLSHCGNVFLKGIMDGHPNILLLQYNTFSNNIFSYCIRLSIEKSENILSVFQSMLKEEMNENEFLVIFPFWTQFKRRMEKWLLLREEFTSQELFVIFHAAFTEMAYGEEIEDMSQKVIYFDPHWIWPVERFSLVKWLEDEMINGQIITIRRDGIAWLCSRTGFAKCRIESLKLAGSIVKWMVQDIISVGVKQDDLQYYEKFEVRFEDLKLHPKEELSKICGLMKIPWSDSMLHTTYEGKTSSMGAIKDFDLKPVFNKHEDEWSEFDRFRLFLISSLYQKKYGYSYEDCTKFSRTELWELFLKEFRFQQELQFNSIEERAIYYLWAYESIRWKLWENRKHIIMDDIKSVFKPIEIGKPEEQCKKELKAEQREQIRANRKYFVELIKRKEKMVIYGLGADGVALWECLDEMCRLNLVLCDKKAKDEIYYFQGRQVVGPKELCMRYKDYEILITSSRFYREIYKELIDMGIDADRIICNKIPFYEEDE